MKSICMNSITNVYWCTIIVHIICETHMYGPTPNVCVIVVYMSGVKIIILSNRFNFSWLSFDLENSKRVCCMWVLFLGFDSCTTSSQQVYNTLSHEGGPIHWTPPSCDGVLCTCCVGVVNLIIFFFTFRVFFSIFKKGMI
jgi:hypothetical protein